MKDLSFRECLRLAQKEELKSDPNVFLYGLDVDDHKGIFGSTLDLAKEFGPERVFGTSLAEESMTGFGIGAAIAGKKPVHIHIRADFALLALNQLINMASNIHYLSNGLLNVPMTIRMIIGRGWGQGAQHSKSLHSVLAHFPGLKVLVPSTPQDAYHLLRSAIQDPNPVVFLEHRWLYDITSPVDLTAKPQLSQVMRPGSDISIIASSWMTVEALKAAEILELNGISAEVVDIKSMSPLDLSLAIQSVKKTGHAIVADHDWIDFGFATTCSHHLYRSCFQNIKKPIQALGLSPFPCPTARPLEDRFYSKAQDIISLAFETLGRSAPNLENYEFWSYENKFRGPF